MNKKQELYYVLNGLKERGYIGSPASVMQLSTGQIK